MSNTVILRSFSKTFSIPGWRIGFAITTPDRIERMAVHHDALYLGGSTIAQYALGKTLSRHLEKLNVYVDHLRETLQLNRDQLAEAFTQYEMDPLPVPATYYMLLRHNRSSDIAAQEELLAKKVAITPGCFFYADPEQNTNYIRIHLAIDPKDRQKVVEILSR